MAALTNAVRKLSGVETALLRLVKNVTVNLNAIHTAKLQNLVSTAIMMKLNASVNVETEFGLLTKIATLLIPSQEEILQAVTIVQA